MQREQHWPVVSQDAVEARADVIMYPGILNGTARAEGQVCACGTRVPVTTSCSRSAGTTQRLLPAPSLLSQQVPHTD